MKAIPAALAAAALIAALNGCSRSGGGGDPAFDDAFARMVAAEDTNFETLKGPRTSESDGMTIYASTLQLPGTKGCFVEIGRDGTDFLMCVAAAGLDEAGARKAYADAVDRARAAAPDSNLRGSEGQATAGNPALYWLKNERRGVAIMTRTDNGNYSVTYMFGTPGNLTKN